MIELHSKGYFPLTKEILGQSVPQRPGIFQLAVLVSNGIHQPFHTEQTENLRARLGMLMTSPIDSIPVTISSCLNEFRVYFTFYEIDDPRYRSDVEKLLSMTADPVMRLHLRFE